MIFILFFKMEMLFYDLFIFRNYFLEMYKTGYYGTIQNKTVLK